MRMEYAASCAVMSWLYEYCTTAYFFPVLMQPYVRRLGYRYEGEMLMAQYRECLWLKGTTVSSQPKARLLHNLGSNNNSSTKDPNMVSTKIKVP